MLKKLIDWYEDWKFEREFQKKKAEIMKQDPFIYNIPSETDDHPGAEPTRYNTWETKGKDIDF